MIEQADTMEELLLAQGKAENAMIRGLAMMSGGVRSHLSLREAAGRIAAKAGIANPISSMINGAPMPARELDYLVAFMELAVRKLRAGQKLDRDGLSHP